MSKDMIKICRKVGGGSNGDCQNVGKMFQDVSSGPDNVHLANNLCIKPKIMCTRYYPAQG